MMTLNRATKLLKKEYENAKKLELFKIQWLMLCTKCGKRLIEKRANLLES